MARNRKAAVNTRSSGGSARSASGTSGRRGKPVSAKSATAKSAKPATGKPATGKPTSGSTHRPVDLSRLKLHSVHDRGHISQIDTFAGTPDAGVSFHDWFESLPGFLGVKKLRAVVDAMVAARRAGKPVVFAMGGHVVKVGCGPVILDLMRRGLVTAIACHGATAIHDVEIAMLGATSEDVGDTIRDGRFGMVRETMDFFARAADRADREQIGFGQAIGQLILDRKFPHADYSLLAGAARMNLPATVHVAIGTDTVHMSGKMDGRALGAATLLDFRKLCGVVADMGDRARGGKLNKRASKTDMLGEPRETRRTGVAGEAGGVWCNIGSAVLMPEVFLKAVSVARNLGADLDAMTTVNFDMLRHYRPAQNVVGRPVSPGRGHDLAGHHEILIPLLRQALIERGREQDD